MTAALALLPPIVFAYWLSSTIRPDVVEQALRKTGAPVPAVSLQRSIVFSTLFLSLLLALWWRLTRPLEGEGEEVAGG